MNGVEKTYYVMRYSAEDRGCPIVLSGFFNCDEFEWDPLESNPSEIEVKKSYTLKLSGVEMDLDDLNFDFYQVGDTYVSKKFLAICDELGAKYKAIPLEIVHKGKSRKDDFFIFLPGESLAALDKSKSEYLVSKDLETGAEIENLLYPGSVSIDSVVNFVVSAAIESDIFRCQETLELFCSEKFKVAASYLKGIQFERIDEHYKYDAWAELDNI